MTIEQIESIFTYRTPFGDQPVRYQLICKSAKQLAHLINEACPESREKSVALINLNQTVMWANAAIAINEKEKEAL